MKKILLSLLLLSCAAFAQENLHTVPQALVTVKHTQPLTEDLGQKVHDVFIVARHADGTVYATRHVHNLRTNAGADAQASQMANTATQAAACNFIAVSNDATAPAATDTTLAGEITLNGEARAQGTYSHTNGTSTFTVTKAFSVTGTQASQKTAVFNAASTGTLCWEASYSQITNTNGDTLTVTWSVNE